ncbi:MAG: helix-turn-helix domain-containing protein [Caldisericaceae bacterium]
MDIGKALREKREELGLSLDDIAERTLIRQYYLEEIEDNKFPSYDGYTAAYIRKYAESLGLEPEPLIELYKELFKGKEDVLKPKDKHRSNSLAVIVIVIAIIGLLLLIVYNNRVKAPTVNPSQETSNPSLPVTPVTPSQPNPSQNNQTSPQETGVHLVLKGTGLCWLGVTIDGKYSQTYIHSGETLEFKGTQYITIRYGFAPYVSVTKNGKELGVVSTKNKVVEITYTP